MDIKIKFEDFEVKETQEIGTVKVLMLKGEKGDQGDAGDYNDLANKPEINGIQLEGNLSADDLNLATAENLEGIRQAVLTNTDNISAVASEVAEKAEQTDLDDLTTRVTTAESDIDDAETAIGNIETALTNLDTRITADEADISENASDIDGLQDRMTSVEETIPDLQSRLTDVEDDKLDLDGDGKDVTVTFSEASVDADIQSGETLATLFGKIKKRLNVIISAITASIVSFNNTISGLTATNVQDAIDELNQNDFYVIEGQERTITLSGGNSTWYSFGKPAQYSGDITDWGNVDIRTKIISVLPVVVSRDAGSITEPTGAWTLNDAPVCNFRNRSSTTASTVTFKGIFIVRR